VGTRTKKHHYVPQFLLRHFATGSRKNPKIWTLDKSTKVIRWQSVRDVAHENAFYEQQNQNGSSVELEHLMEKLDGIGSRIIRQVIESGSLALSVEDRIWFSYVVACQMSRTPMIRKDIDNLRAMIINKWGPSARAEGSTRAVGELGPEDSKGSALRLLAMDTPEFAKILQGKSWFLAEAPPDSPFIIGDNPVTRHNMLQRPGRGNLGLNNKGIELYLPLSPRYSLHLVCPVLTEILCSDHANETSYVRALRDGTPVRLLPENVTFANSCQVIWAERWVFGRNRTDLDLPIDMLRTNPELMEGPGVRQRPDED
jgi:hypothetical protein